MIGYIMFLLAASLWISTNGFFPPWVPQAVTLTTRKSFVELDSESLTLTCTVADPQKHNISEAVFKADFKEGGTLPLPGDINVISQTTAQLTLANISSESFGGHQLRLYCSINGTSSQSIVEIGKKPLQPSIICSIKNLIELDCHLAPNKTSQVNHTRIGNERNVFIKISPQWQCLAVEQCTDCGTCLTCKDSWDCNWDLSSYNLTIEDTLYMHATVGNNLGTTPSDLVPVKLIEITKLNKTDVDSISVSRGSRSLDLLIPRARDETKYQDIVYMVDYREEWDPNTWIQKEFEMGADTNPSNLTLGGLTPHSNIYITIKIKLKGSLHWSEESDILQSQTLAEVPKNLPNTTIGAFHWISKNILRLYWQPLTKKDKFGDRFRYKVVVVTPGLSTANVTETADLVTADVSFIQDKDWNISLTIGNEAGMNKDLQQLFYIQSSDKKLPPGPMDIKVDVYNSGKTILQWNIPKGKDIKGTTIYWCKKPPQQTQNNKCQGKLHWHFVPNPVNVKVLKLEEPEEMYNFALSIDYLDRSSGMTFAPCPQYEKIEKEEPPQFEFPGDQNNYKIVMTWNRICDHSERSILIGYEISYYKAESEEESGDIQVVEVGPEIQTLTLDNLSPRKTYSVKIAAVSMSGAKQYSKPKMITVKGLTLGLIAAIVIGGIVVLVFFIGGIFAIHRQRKKITETNFIEAPKTEIPMQTPADELNPGHTYQHLQRNALDKKVTSYQRQESGLGHSVSSDHRVSVGDDASDTVFEADTSAKHNSTITERGSTSPDSGVSNMGRDSQNLGSFTTGLNSTSEEPEIKGRDSGAEHMDRNSYNLAAENPGTYSGDSQFSYSQNVSVEYDPVSGYSKFSNNLAAENPGTDSGDSQFSYSQNVSVEHDPMNDYSKFSNNLDAENPGTDSGDSQFSYPQNVSVDTDPMNGYSKISNMQQ